MAYQSLRHAIHCINTDYKHILEFGVQRGESTNIIRQLSNPSMQIYGFDSFLGLPEDWKDTPCHKGFFSTNGVVPRIEGVTFYKGWFEDTIPKYLKIAQPIALLHIDCDLYSSTKTIFKYLHPYIQKGTILAFDEWCYNHNSSYNDHEQKAFYEFVNKHNIEYEFIDYNDPEKNETKIVRIL